MAVAALLGACGDDPADEAPGQVTTTAVASQAATTTTTVAGRSYAADFTSADGHRYRITLAVGGSVSSGCATAVNYSTASGAPCPPATTTPPRTAGPTPPAGGTGGTTTAARPAATTAAASRSLALTGSDNGELAGAGALALLAGALMVRAGRKEDTARTA